LRTLPKLISGATLAGMFLFFLSACERPKTIGAEIVPPGDVIGLLFTDTVKALPGTLVRDSTRTDETGMLMFGNLIDPEFGRIHTASFAQFRMTGSNLVFGDSLILDSLVLELGLDGFYGNYSDPQKLRVYELDENMIREGEYFNTDSLAVKGNNLALKTELKFNAGSELLSGIKIRLSDALGNRILQAGPDNLLNNQSFLQFFKGLYFSTEAVPQSSREPGAIYYVRPQSPATKLTLYYRGKMGEVFYDTLSYSFLINDDAAYFNKITRSEYAGRLFGQSLQDTSGNAQPYIFLQAGMLSDIWLKIPDLPALRPAIVNRAMLEIAVLDEFNGANSKYLPPRNLDMFYADENGRAALSFGTLTYNAEKSVYQLSSALPFAQYCQTVISGRLPNYGVIIRSSAPSTSINRVVLGGPGHPTRAPRFHVYYTLAPQ
jgi:hypothetical protein